jgi:murein DD-endopeptidase MepM/ murein hydrolase activator NlpD
MLEKKVQTPKKVNSSDTARRASAMLGLAAISMGATAGVLIASQGDEAIAAEPAFNRSDAGQVDMSPLEQSTSLIQHRIQDGDTLWDLSQSYNVPADAIAASNNLPADTVLSIGQTLVIPAADAAANPVVVAAAEPIEVAVADITEDDYELAAIEAVEKDSTPKASAVIAETEAPAAETEPQVIASARPDQTVHAVRSGETVAEIAAQYNVTPNDILASNNITDPRTLQIAQELIIPGVASPAATADETAAAPIAPAAAPELVTQNTTTLATQLNDPSPDNRISRLKEEVMQMREEYRAQRARQTPTTAQAAPAPSVTPIEPQAQPASPEWQRQQQLRKPGRNEVVVPQPEAAPQANQQSDLVAAAPTSGRGYNRLLQLPAGQSVEPQIPPLQERDQYLPDRPQEFNGYIWPARGVLTSGYGPRWGRMHRGIDIAAPTGTPIHAAASGEVISAGWNSGGYGNLVEIRHPDGSMTRYAHNSKLLVRKGDRVEQGQQVALMGSTGFSTGPHLHFEVHPAGSGATNPMAFLPSR